MKGSKVPASLRIPKKRMAKMNITPIGAIPRIPEVMYSGNCVPIPAISPMIKGMLIIATIADNFFDMMDRYETRKVKRRQAREAEEAKKRAQAKPKARAPVAQKIVKKPPEKSVWDDYF